MPQQQAAGQALRRLHIRLAGTHPASRLSTLRIPCTVSRPHHIMRTLRALPGAKRLRAACNRTRALIHAGMCRPHRANQPASALHCWGSWAVCSNLWEISTTLYTCATHGIHKRLMQPCPVRLPQAQLPRRKPCCQAHSTLLRRSAERAGSGPGDDRAPPRWVRSATARSGAVRFRPCCCGRPHAARPAGRQQA